MSFFDPKRSSDPMTRDDARLAPSAQSFIDYTTTRSGLDFSTATIDDIRDDSAEIELRFDCIAPPMAEEFDVEIGAEDGGTFVSRIYVPRKLDTNTTLPVLVFMHGGGFCLCDIETHQNMCRYLCASADIVGVNVGYRLAPEHKFPTGVNDCASAVDWVAENISAYGGDPSRIGVAGASAGGNFSAVLAQRSARGEGPKLMAQVLCYPSLDMANRGNYPSWSRLAPLDFLISEASREWVIEQYLHDTSEMTDVRASPMLASDLRGNPSALIITAEYDPLVDEGAAYADRLSDAGCEVEYTCYPGIIHGFMSMAGGIPEGYKALDQAAEFLRDKLRRA